jgi:hypothetical protein
MIRIDELYNNTFWPYITKNIPLTRLFFCDPPGRSDPDALFNFGSDTIESNYIFLHDQEPIHLDIHRPLFDDVVRRNLDLNNGQGARHRAIVTSEWNSEFVDQVCSQYDWSHYYYFWHGWAALDWYRGYHRTFLMTPPEDREIRRSFISPNRIIGGKRDHRVLLLYHIFKNGVRNAWVSCPETCPYENVPISDIGARFSDRYQDIEQVFKDAPVPLHFPGETDHPMHSCWLSLFDQVDETLAYVVTETVFFGRRNHITEKTFKPICQQLPFVLASTAGSLEYLRRYGFQTFSSIWDESYDEETNDLLRIEKIAALLRDLDAMTPRELNQMYQAVMPIVKHNYEHFYGGGFERLLWPELTGMLDRITNDFRV